ncbi:hypothetical protein H4R99_005131 [Coemansia sp. RSA 1722]|nr:hypothetical protein LPJ57_001743 [Coemansia sp. RSA 486]KAJ2595935.1 hypothetical protein H4R99_005131 [Coemansia sp. RSA 1722]KAJ2600773.1 hypothetical protein GGF39_001610 [Coemansia sp. RSA 1721]KAJ2636812.1 hypothetical protein GGF40_002781 [Coemansia sp. RSA 1286]
MSLVVYTHGSCINERRSKASSGIGVFFGPNDARNVSERILGPIQTTTRAELEAIRKAIINLGVIDQTSTRPVIIIGTYSQKAIDSLVGFQDPESLNYGIIQDIRNRVYESGYFVKLQRIPISYSNKHIEAAQLLAMSAARRKLY